MFHLTRLRVLLVLLSYLAALGVAVAAPIVHPKRMDLVCSGTSFKLVDLDAQADGGDGAKSHTLDCALCVPGGILNTFPVAGPQPPHDVLAYVLRAIPAARLAGIVAAPLPARGPPHFA